MIITLLRCGSVELVKELKSSKTIVRLQIVVMGAKKTSKTNRNRTGGATAVKVYVDVNEDDSLETIESQPSSTSCDYLTRGLESLATVDQLILKQGVDFMEVAIGIEEANKYTVFDTDGNVMFTVEEETSCCNRFCCGVCRSFNVMIMDTQGQPIIQLVSPNTCNCCCLRSIEVQSPPGTVIGFAKQQFTLFYPKISIQKCHGEALFTANGSFCAIGKCIAGDADFVLTNNMGEEVNNIHKHENEKCLQLIFNRGWQGI